MVFSSIFFIFVFLPVFLLIYYLVPNRLQNPILLIGSLFFYAWGDPVYLLLMIFSCVFNYFMGLELERLKSDLALARINLIFTIVVNLFILGFFKYFGFFVDSIGSLIGKSISYPELALPIGISFYTFKNLSYIFDIYQGKISAQRNFLIFGVYSTMFPHMVSGPIVRYSDIKETLYSRTLNIGKLGIGAELFLKGLTKKVLLADNLAIIYNGIVGAEKLSLVSAWLGILAYTLEIYFDFSGYSDMAIGLGKMLGFSFKQNFDHPYTSHSVSEFWRRWHISLGSWFRDYIYIPLGGNRVSVIKQIRNIFVVWALTGLWHGASLNFIIWGLYYGLLLLIEKFILKNILPKIPKPVTLLYTMIAVMIGWVFFSQTDFSAMGHYLAAMFGAGASGFVDSTALYYLKTGLLIFVISILTCHPGVFILLKQVMHKRPGIATVLHIVMFILCIAFMVYNSYTPFLYLQF